MRRKRADANQERIVEALRRAGYSVLVLSQVGGNCPDLLVGAHGKNLLLEIKSPEGELSEGQYQFRMTWAGPVAVARSVDEALLAVATA